MAINYSLGLRSSSPSDKKSEKKVYAYAQMRELITLPQLAKHICLHGSPYGRDVIIGVMTAVVDCVRENLLEGNKVQLGEMGAFYLAFNSQGVDTAEDFNPANNINQVRVRWERGSAFADLTNEAEFNYVTSRDQQAKAKKEEKATLNAGIVPADSSGDDGGITGGSGQTE
jgi:predicted histone-like DNA-binding protein